MIMAKFLSCAELIDTIQKKSKETKEILWVCSPDLGSGAHNVFLQEILKNPPSDIRFIFNLNELSVKQGKISPYEIQFFMEQFDDGCVKSLDAFHSNIFVFDDSAILTSSTLKPTAFENDVEVGVLVNGSELDQIKKFFTESLWANAKPIGDLKKLKFTWNLAQKNAATKVKVKKTKPQPRTKEWTDDYAHSWYIGVANRLPTKTERRIKQETGWGTELLVVGDVGYPAYKQLKLGDLTYLVNLYKKHGKIEIELAHVFDKSRIETDEGDLHIACRAEKRYLLSREQFYQLLKTMNIHSRTSETTISNSQLKLLIECLGSIKQKRKRSKPPQVKNPKKKKP